jgi:hypothetical protein
VYGEDGVDIAESLYEYIIINAVVVRLKHGMRSRNRIDSISSTCWDSISVGSKRLGYDRRNDRVLS